MVGKINYSKTGKIQSVEKTNINVRECENKSPMKILKNGMRLPNRNAN